MEEEKVEEEEETEPEVTEEGTEEEAPEKETTEEPETEDTKEVGSFERAMHKAVCADCGKETEVPFKPTEGRPVYCRDCYRKHGSQSRGRRRF